MLKHLSKVRIEYSPLDRRAGSALEFLAQCHAPKSRASNPNCEVIIKRRTGEAPPVVTVTFTNGREEVMDGLKMAAQHMRKRVFEQAELMETEKMFRDAGHAWPVVFPADKVEVNSKKKS